jgi:transcription elongation factor Elf1
VMANETGICPACNGTKRVQAEARQRLVSFGWDEKTDTLTCRNCGAQRMWGSPTGQVLLRKDGTPCLHEYGEHLAGNCLHEFTCKHCGDSYLIDSGD